jgi:glutamate 5-kinase
MWSKLQSAGMVAAGGIPVVIANGRASNVIDRVMAGGDVGTLVSPGGMAASLQSHRKRWMAFFHTSDG